MTTLESISISFPKQETLDLIELLAMEGNWKLMDGRNMLRSGDVRQYRHRNNWFPNESPQFYEEYYSVYNRGKLVSAHYDVSIPSGGEWVWDNNADLMTTFVINTATKKLVVTQLLAPWKEPGEVDLRRSEAHRLYGIDRISEEEQWQTLGSMLRHSSIE